MSSLSNVFQTNQSSATPPVFQAKPRGTSPTDDAEKQRDTPQFTSTPPAKADSIEFKKPPPPVTTSPSASSEPPTPTKATFSFAPIVTACGGLLGTLLGGAGGFSLASAIAKKQATETQEIAPTSSIQTLDAIGKNSVYLQRMGGTIALSPEELTAPSLADSHYYEFTPEAIQTTQPTKASFELIHHQPNRNVQVQYQFQHPQTLAQALAENEKTTIASVVPKLNQINVISPDGLNESVTINEAGQPVIRIRTIKTDAGTIENHQWQYIFDPFNPNRTVEQYSIFPATQNATGGGYHTATDALPTSVTLYEKVFDDTTSSLKEIQVLTNTTAERLLFDEKGKVIKRFEATDLKQVNQLQKRFQAILEGDTSWFEQFYNNHLTAKPATKGSNTNPSLLDSVANIYSDVQILERKAAAKLRGWAGFDKLTREVAIKADSIKPSDALALHPKAQLTTAIDNASFVDGATLLKPLATAWYHFKATYHATHGTNVKQTIGQRFAKVTEAFQQTSTGQKVGLAIGAILGGALGVWALFPKKPKESATGLK